jgi:hypothetical protein
MCHQRSIHDGMPAEHRIMLVACVPNLQQMHGGCAKACADSDHGVRRFFLQGSSLKAQAMFAKQNAGRDGGAVQEPMLSSAEAADFLSSLEGGMKEVMRQANWDAMKGEPARRSSTEASEHSIARITLNEVSGAKVSQLLPKLTGIQQEAAFDLPSSFSADVFGTETPEVDLHLQVHHGPPSVGGHVTRSALVGMTVSRARAQSETPVSNLTQPFNLTIPIDQSSMPLSSRMILAQQVWFVGLGPQSHHES